MLWILVAIVSLTDSSNARPTNGSNAVGEKSCRVGNVSFPVPVFESYAGWECYEETYRGLTELTVHVCVEAAGDAEFSVPCFKSNGRMLSFNLKNEESVLAILEAFGSRELNDEMIRCYLNVVTACETSLNGWLGYHGGYKYHVSNTSGNACGLEGQSKFHIAMLSISLITGIPIVLVFCYATVLSANLVLSHCRNLILALMFRTLFSLLIETEVVSEIIQTPPGEAISNWAGCEALASFECISLNLVLAFWLILTFHLFESSKGQFRKMLDIGRGFYIVLGLALTFPIIWIIIMGSGDYGNCWLVRTPVQWVNDSLRLGFILLQMFLVFVVCFQAVDGGGEGPDTGRKVILFLLVLSPLFLLQFALSASHPVEMDGGEAHIYTEFFIDGLQCAIVSVVTLYNFMYLFSDFQFRLPNLTVCLERNRVFETMRSTEMEIRQGDAPPRVARFPKKKTDDEENKDITYTSVLTPERFERTIKLYNRLNIIPRQETIGEVSQDNLSVKSEYFDVDTQSINTVYNDVLNQTTNDTKLPYYSSKYLVHDSESSITDESVIEVMSQAKSTLPSISSSTTTLPKEPDASRNVEKWLTNCQRDFHESTIRNKSAVQKQNGLGRTLSGSENHGTMTVRLNKTESVLTKRGSAPSLVTYDEKKELRREKQLPGIYDDLKKYQRRRKVRSIKKRDYNSNWSTYRNRILEIRRGVKSLNDFETAETDQDERSQRQNVVLNPSFGRNPSYEPPLKRNHFSRMEDLTQFGTDNVDDGDKRTMTDGKKEFYDVVEVKI